MTATWGCPSTEANAASRRDAYFIEVTALRRENGDLRQRVRELEAQLKPRTTIKAPVHLTGKERLLLEALMREPERSIVSRERLRAALYPGPRDHSTGGFGIVDVFMMQLRAKLRSVGVVIETCRGQGFFAIEGESRKIVAGW